MISTLHQATILISATIFLFIQTCCASDASNRTAHTYNLDESIERNFQSYSPFALYYFPAIHHFDRYFTIVLFVIGFPGNFISFLVWSNRRMYHNNSAAVYLAALSLNDTIVLAISLFRDLIRTWEVHFKPTPGSCEVLETINLTVQYASPMFVLAFTMERWLAICQPFLVSRISSVKLAVKICCAIIIFTLMVCSPMAYLMRTDETGCQPRSGAVFYFTTTLEVIYSLVTPLLVLTFNCLVINEMARIRRSQMKKMLPGEAVESGGGSTTSSWNLFKRLFTRTRQSHIEDRVDTKKTLDGRSANRQQPDIPRRSRTESEGGMGSPTFKSTTIMLLVVSFYVIFATLLGGFWYLMDIKYSIDDYSSWTMTDFNESPLVGRLLKLRMCKTICDELALSHFAMGFVLYYLTGKNFRDGVHALFRRVNIFSRGKHSTDGGLSSFGVETTQRRSTARNLGGRESSTKTTDALLLLSSPRQHSPLRLMHFSLRGKHKRDEFPGLDTCGHRGERQPSKLIPAHRSGMNGLPHEPLKLDYPSNTAPVFLDEK